VRERRELEIESQERQDRLAARLTRPLIVVGGVVGALCAVFAVGVLFAHPAGAAPPPPVPALSATPDATSATPSLPIPAVAGDAAVAEEIVPQLQTIVTTTGTPVSTDLGATVVPVVTQLRSATAPLSTSVPVLATAATGPIVQGLEPVVGPIVQTLTQAVTAVSGGVSQVVAAQPSVGSAPLPIARKAPSAGAAKDAVLSSATLGNPAPSPSTPGPSTPPFQPLPLVTSGSPSGDSPSSPGSGAIAVNPGSGLLLPDPAVSRVDSEQSKTPGLLFDSRYSPPG
jgi:hypothetical protein